MNVIYAVSLHKLQSSKVVIFYEETQRLALTHIKTKGPTTTARSSIKTPHPPCAPPTLAVICLPSFYSFCSLGELGQ